MSNHFISKHTGLHFLDQKEDLILTGLLSVALSQPSCDLSKVMIDISTILDDINALVDEGLHIPIFKYRKVPFCKTTTVEVPLYCICWTPWIDGSTAKIIWFQSYKGKFRENIQKFQNFYISLLSLTNT